LPDTTAPSVPAGVTSTNRTVNSISLSWTASTDNIGVTGYKILRNNVQVATSTTTSYNNTGLTPNTSYTYSIQAYDAAGNTSVASTGLPVSTLPDTTAPTVPSGLVSPSQTTNSINLSWSPSTDNVGVAGYKIFRDGVQVGTSTTTSFTSTGLTQNTSYSFTVAAYDAAGNTSAQSTAASFKTLFKAGDVNGDGTVGIVDLSIIASHWNLTGQTSSTGDLNGDGAVNIVDLSILATNWGK
jgi:chitodextrinase